MSNYNTNIIMKIFESQKEEGVQYRGHATNNNTKLGKAIPNINLPPVITCNPNAPCFKECYGRKGRFCFKNVKNSMLHNLFAFCQNPKRFFEDIANQTKLNLYVRWFGDGDMPNEEFLAGMCKVARKNPNTLYLSFTKQYGIVNNYVAQGHRIPKNLRIVFSCWKDWIPDNPYHFPTTWVRFPEADKKGKITIDHLRNREYNKLIPINAFECKHKCSECQQCWKLKKGQSVVFDKH